MKLKKTLAASLVIAAMTAMSAASAQTVRIGNQGDALSMDPHSLNESLQLSFTGNVYEPLVGRDKKLGLTPALAAPAEEVRIDRSLSVGSDRPRASAIVLRTRPEGETPRA